MIRTMKIRLKYIEQKQADILNRLERRHIDKDTTWKTRSNHMKYEQSTLHSLTCHDIAK